MQSASATLKRRQEWAQPALVLLSAAMAYLLPFEGLFYSYALLGPAHYLTQLNWLHERNFFVADRAVRFLFLGTGVVGLCFMLFLPKDAGIHGTLYMVVMFGIAVILLAGFNVAIVAVLSIVLAVVGWLIKDLPATFLVMALLLPTVIHVGLFTLLFLLVGARRRGDAAGKVTVLLWVGAAALLLAVPPEVRLVSSDWFNGQRQFFDGVAERLGGGPGKALDRGWAAAYGLLTFAYTYHYLNWFSKTELLQWHRIPRLRLYPIIAIYAVSIGLYAYDYQLGFAVLPFLSFLHVVAEFPLDVQVVRNLVRGQLPARAIVRAGGD